jgi:hypothetical protein
MLQKILRTAAAMLIVTAIADTGASTSNQWQRPAAAPAPADNHLTETLRNEARALMSSVSEFSQQQQHEPAAA